MADDLVDAIDGVMLDTLQKCPYYSRLGVCLEPDACVLNHPVMKVTSEAFIPSKKGTVEESKEPAPETY